MKFYSGALIVILMIVLPGLSYTQTLTGSELDSLAARTIENAKIVYADKFDMLPDSISVSGIVQEATTCLSCGVVCNSGTIRVELDGTITGYPYKEVYAVIPCLSGERGSYTGKEIDIKVVKLFSDTENCYTKSIVNNIDSKGIPFYWYDIDKEGGAEI